jgi:hypothetical protein
MRANGRNEVNVSARRKAKPIRSIVVAVRFREFPNRSVV